MATKSEEHEARQLGSPEADHDAFVRAKTKEGLAQSRDRAALIPLDRAWRDLTGERL